MFAPSIHSLSDELECLTRLSHVSESAFLTLSGKLQDVFDAVCENRNASPESIKRARTAMAEKVGGSQDFFANIKSIDILGTSDKTLSYTSEAIDAASENLDNLDLEIDKNMAKMQDEAAEATIEATLAIISAGRKVAAVKRMAKTL